MMTVLEVIGAIACLGFIVFWSMFRQRIIDHDRAWVRARMTKPPKNESRS